MPHPQDQTALFIGGHDPSGGAGLTADIQTASTLGIHPLTLVTALTVQDTGNVERVEPLDPDWFEASFRKVISDMRPAAIKVGLLGSPELGERLATLLENTHPIPVVLDPVWKASGGFLLARDGWAEILRDRLVPTTTLLTPNTTELRTLVPSTPSTDEAAGILLSLGAGAILVTGGDQDLEQPYVTSILYTADGETERWNDVRLPGAFHGSGCTLAAACTCYLARGDPLKIAVRQALRWTHQTLVKALAIGRGGRIPLRGGRRS